MITFCGRCVLLDIEGTTSSIRFVHERMFPYVRQHLAEFVQREWGSAPLTQALDLIAVDLGKADAIAWYSGKNGDPRTLVIQEVHRQMDLDLKATGLKALQGLIWKAGFASGELIAPIYPDVLRMLGAWRSQGLIVAIYSSGSVASQRLFFGHTNEGDLLPWFESFFDTTVGSKREAESYRRIAQACGVAPREMVFLSDLPAELDAARQAGLSTVLICRPENPPVTSSEHPRANSFDALNFSCSVSIQDVQRS